ncbi:MAG: hypothetical protein IJ983_04790, partial [Kiritimatiellae bacterium]|nr:hypothetical protein [Kiritimatiellia bacterium]
GVARSVYEAAAARGVEVADATCPFVSKIHRIVSEAKGTVLIAGDRRGGEGARPLPPRGAVRRRRLAGACHFPAPLQPPVQGDGQLRPGGARQRRRGRGAAPEARAGPDGNLHRLGPPPASRAAPPAVLGVVSGPRQAVFQRKETTT